MSRKLITALSVGGLAMLLMLGIFLLPRKGEWKTDTFRQDSGINICEVDGITCRKKTRMKAYLFLGCDAQLDPEGEQSEGLVVAGQSDMIELLVIDQNEDTYATIPINRNTMTMIDSLEEDGTFIASSEAQICLAHAKGDGREISCENAVKAVSDLLYGIPIDGYIAMSLSSIGAINDLVGGVTVTIEDDFSKEDPSLVMGSTVTLNAKQAESFVRGRMSVADGSNENRMKRQNQYLAEYKKLFMEKCAASERFVLNAYKDMDSYMVTDLSGNDCSKIAKAILKNDYLGNMEISGTVGEDHLGYATFEPDHESIRDIVIDLFYERLDETNE